MKRIFFFFILTVASSLIAENQHAISYEGGSRFGDRLLVYAQARYLSYLTGTRFFYRPFLYSDQLSIDFSAQSYEEQKSRYRKVEHIHSAKSLVDFFCKVRDPGAVPTLFIVDYFPSDITEWEVDESREIVLDIPWQDPGFSEYLKRSLTPRVSIPDLRKEGYLNVADHVRTLSGTDTVETSIFNLPLKHPSLNYHRNQIRRVYELNLKRPMHVFLFSDTKDPQRLLDDFRQFFRNEQIIFDIQFLENPDTDHVLQDFFAMQKFDVLIATQSNFSMMSWRCGSLGMVLFPVHMKGKYPNSEVDRVQLISKKTDWFPYELDLILKDFQQGEVVWFNAK